MASGFANSPLYSSRKQRGSGKGRSYSSILPAVETIAFKYGLMTYFEPQQIPRGAASDEINFLTRGSKIETRNGYTPLGLEINGTGSSKGTFTAHRWDGTEIIFRVRSGKLEYFDDPTGTWIESGSNEFAAAPGETVTFAEYLSDAGAQLWASSPSTDLLKIMTANPSTPLSQYNAAKNFKGYIRIRLNRMLLWNYLGNTLGRASNASLRGSYIDSQNYNSVTGEAQGTGDGSTKTFNGTLSTMGGVKTAFGVTFTDTHETFADDYNGNLVGDMGGTGTINYVTGVYSITFFAAPANSQAITASYATEDATQGGIADFTHSGTRLAGEGFVFLQNDGGKLLNVFSLNGSEYCLHERKAWVLTLGVDDTTATNLIYRDRMSLSSLFGGVATADGIYYIDTTLQSRPYVALLSYNAVSNLVLPADLSSEVLDLSGYSFDQCVAWEWEKYILFSMRTTDSPTNNRVLLFNKELKCFDVVDFYANNFCIKSGALYAGDSATVNVYNLFSGFDDNGSVPNYAWTGNVDDHGMLGLKKTKKLWIEGEIDVNQNTDVYVSLDRGSFVKVGTISGGGSYVDRGQAVLIGSLIVGLNLVGGGSNGASAFHYLCQLKLRLDKYKYFQVRFVPVGIGYFSATMYTNFDVRTKEDKLPSKYRN